MSAEHDKVWALIKQRGFNIFFDQLKTAENNPQCSVDDVEYLKRHIKELQAFIIKLPHVMCACGRSLRHPSEPVCRACLISKEAEERYHATIHPSSP